MAKRASLPITINRRAPAAEPLPFTDYFKGFESVEAVRSVFGKDTKKVLANLKVAFMSPKFMYMGIRDEDGCVMVGSYHLRNSDLRTLYLDIVHELFHIKQWRNDREYFGREHRKFSGDWSRYWTSPIEVPAYEHTVREAERIGMSRAEIVEHLKMGPVPPKTFANFLKVMKINPRKDSPRTVKFSVRINRKAPVALFPFTDYFEGFEEAEAVRAIFGESAGKELGRLKVEFVNSSWIRAIPSEEDGHIILGLPYLASGGLASIYLDILACMSAAHYSKRRSGGKDTSALLESYRLVVKEGRRLGLSDSEILKHLDALRFMMNPAEYRRFLRRLGFSPQPTDS